VPAGRDCHEIASTIDLLPTVAKLIGGTLSKNTIDGKDIWPLLSGRDGAKSPHDAFLYYSGSELHAVRSGEWKLHLPHPYLVVAGEPGKNGKPSNFENLKPDDLTKSGVEGIATRHGYKIEKCGVELYNLKDDVGESKNIAESNPEVVKRLQQVVDRARLEFGDSLTGKKGNGVRPAGKVP
jgi:arylsulfatase